VLVDDREVLERPLADDDGQAPEPSSPSLLDKGKRRQLVARDHRRAAPAQRRRDGPLVSRGHVQSGEDERMAFLGERPSSRRNPFALREHPLERAKPLARLVEAALAAQVHGKAWLRRGFAQGCEQRRSTLAPQRDPLGAAPEAVERGRRRLAAAGGVRELLLRAVPLGEQVLELRIAALLGVVGGRAPLLRCADLLVDPGEVDHGDRRLQRGDLAAQLLGALGGGRLERQRPQPLLHFGLDVPRALDVLRDPRELELGTMAATLELPEPSGFLDERASLLGLRGQDLLDLALRDHRARGAAEPDVGKQLHEVEAPDGSTVDEVLALAAAVQASHDRNLRKRQLRNRAVLVVEDELDLAVLGWLAPAGARVEDVVGLLGAELARAQAPRRPQECVGDVRFPGPVRPDDHGDARLEADLDRIREGLEAADADRA
jgi:hypothetical protein